MKHYDAIIIGAGQAGVPLAKKLAEAGKKTLIVEKRWVGGTCINDGCTPTKTIIAAAHVAHQARQAGRLGLEIDTVKIDLKKIMKRKDEIVDSFRTGAKKGIESTNGLDLIHGEATFSGLKELRVKTSDGKERLFSADWIFINTGASAKIPALPGLTKTNYLTSTTILDLKQIPAHLVVLGGNYIGLEFAQLFHRFGSKVTILEKSSRIVGREDEDVSSAMTEILEEEGLKVLTNITIEEVKGAQGELTIQLKTPDGKKNIKASHLLLAIGRTPNTAALNLDIPGIKTDKNGYILVNEKLETNVKGIYALGDVNGGPAFTHIAYNDYTIVFRNLMEQGKHSTADRQVPYCMFTDPQLARVGLSETEAKAKGLDFLVAKIPMTQVARGIETGQTLGFMKAIVDPKSSKILGACMLAAEGGEVMAVLQMAMQGGITADTIRYGVFAHPTFSESLNNLFMNMKAQ
ncbi:dihydrolipoyl dehydrogenase [Pedobacter sp. N36a]|uniref:dihydrolipoyl dehydrogenase n=1 Tax=Pedobacter sp. N36a TaxID=2767996 RepID=UPI001656DAEF|nr:dihydrolipoyl dehydrogenase [Pedobacter sp. N36a]MBC8985035.1 dihydrolipoyl dehydrogenase [Pedobacter sp. N36a]